MLYQLSYQGSPDFYAALLELFLYVLTWSKEKALIFGKCLFYAGTVLECFCIVYPLTLTKVEVNDVQESSGNGSHLR